MSAPKQSGPKQIGNVLANLLAKRGYARVQSGEQYAAAWQTAAGDPLCKFSRAGLVKRGTLEVFCSNSTAVQELTFQKAIVIAKLAELLPQEKIRDLKIRVAPIGD